MLKTDIGTFPVCFNVVSGCLSDVFLKRIHISKGVFTCLGKSEGI